MEQAHMTIRTCDDPTREDMLAHLASVIDEHPHGVREENQAWDIEEAIYWFASDWHGGQGTNLYEALCASLFTPSPMASYIASDSYAGLLYDELEMRYASPPDPYKGWTEIEA
jgi:hypothetical protein